MNQEKKVKDPRYRKLSICSNRCKGFFNQANKLHAKVKSAYWDSVEYARQCGELLIKAKAVKKHGTWKDSVYRSFDGSYPTAANYMYIAKHWNDKVMQKARQGEVPLDSQAAVLRLLRESRQPVKNKRRKKKKLLLPEKEQKQLDFERRRLIEWFSEDVYDTYPEEVHVLFANWEFCLWPKWYGELRRKVCCALEYSPYRKYKALGYEKVYHDSEEELAKIKRRVRRRCVKALNSKRKHSSNVRTPSGPCNIPYWGDDTA